MVTVKQIREKTMTQAKVQEAKNDIFGFYIGRPITYLMSIPFIEWGIKPNTVSLLSLIVAFIGFIFVAFFSSPAIKLVGALFFVLWSFLDGVDGNIARYTEQTSKLGALWDDAAGYTALALMHFAMGISVMNATRQVMQFNQLPDYLFMALGGLSAIFCILERLVMHKKTLIFGVDAGRGFNDKGDFSLAKVIVFNFTSPSGFMLIFMIIALMTGLNNLFVLGYFLLETLIFIYTYYILLH